MSSWLNRPIYYERVPLPAPRSGLIVFEIALLTATMVVIAIDLFL